MDTLLESWHYTSDGESLCVLPDGCQDLIGVQCTGEAPHWFIAPLSDRAYWVMAHPGQRYVGYRLKPGTEIDATRLLKTITRCELEDKSLALQALTDSTCLDSSVHEALHTLAVGASLEQVRSQLTLTERGLQRLLIQHSGRTALYWRRLARWRQTLRQLATHQPLAAVAADMGFSDQAHMSRECQRWSGLSPNSLRQRPELLALACASGFG